MNRRYLIQKLASENPRRWDSLAYVVGVKNADARLAELRRFNSGTFRAIEATQPAPVNLAPVVARPVVNLIF